GWWFAGEKLLIALPLLLPPAAGAALVTLPHLLSTRRRSSPWTEFFPLVAAYGAVAGVVAGVAVGYPLSGPPAIVLVLAVAGGAVATWSIRARKGPPGRAWRIAGAVVTAAALAWTGLSMWNSRPTTIRLAAGPAVAAVQQTSTRVRHFDLTARKATITLASGRRVEALTFNGVTPGPPIRVRQGDTVEVTLRNELQDRGVTLHWHGYRVPNAMDGVPGLTQDAVGPGGSFVYRFVADQPGTYWYHTHETPNLALQQGLFGTFTVDPAPPHGLDEPLPIHTYQGTLTIAGVDGISRRTVRPGTPVRLRVINTDNTPHTVGMSVPYAIKAVDGTDIGGPPTTGRVELAAGGRYDLAFTMPGQPALLSAGRAGTGLVLTPGSRAVPEEPAGPIVDITRYGTRDVTPPARFDREDTWVLDRLIALRNGLPLLSHTVNGQVWPHVPPTVVRNGDWVRVTVVNRSGDHHPMHPHGHRVLVLERDGEATLPTWMDSFDVAPGEVWVVALHADNPGVWLAHCHELTHAAEGMTLHLAYEGAGTPYALDEHNHPE
ncbi:MAG: multicopper oxidase family protein, partial [Nonomuraea sp.]|nr:multicopper oxidase family protein [Nonomuraea sp.]